MKRLVALCTVVVQAATLLGCMRGNGRVNVVLASRDLKAGTIVRSADVNIVDVEPKDAPPSSPYLRSQFIGHRVLTPIAKDQVILTTELSPEAK